MISRRLFCGCLPFALTASAVAAQAKSEIKSTASQEGSACAVMTKARLTATTPDEALDRLRQGNARFVDGHTINCDLRQQVAETADGQAPFAMVMGCIDSRVPPELVFDQRIGDVFCSRIAGNFINDDIIGSAEFATKIMGAKAIVVLGHSSCGAIKGAIDGAELGHLTGALRKIQPAVAATQTTGARNASNYEFVQQVADRNVTMAVEQLTKSPVLAELVAAKQLHIVGAMHDVHSGKVKFFT